MVPILRHLLQLLVWMHAVTCDSVYTDQQLTTMIFQDYDTEINPYDMTGVPTVVRVGLNIDEIFLIDDSFRDFRITLHLQRVWFDPRLQFNLLTDGDPEGQPEITIRDPYLSKLWKPDIYFGNVREGRQRNQTLPNTAAWIKADGTVFYSTRYTMRLACPMDLHKFPLDSQKCPILVRTLSYFSDTLRLRWRHVTPLQLPPVLILRSFVIQGYSLETCEQPNVPLIPGGDQTTVKINAQCIRAWIYLERQYTNFLITIYFPIAAVALISMVCYWLSLDSPPARVNLSAVSVLAVIYQAFIAGIRLPRAPYIKAVDIWIAGCTTFVLVSLVEYALVCVLLRRADGLHKEQLDSLLKWYIDNYCKSDVRPDQDSIHDDDSFLLQVSHFLGLMKQQSLLRRGAENLDKFCRLFIPIAFLSFVITYWVYYMKDKAITSGQLVFV